MVISVNAAENPKTPARSTTKVSSKVPIPTAFNSEEREVLDLLSYATGKNPFLSNDPHHNNKSLMEAIRETKKDGVIDRGKLKEIMKYYEIDKVTKEAWEAFTGGKGKITWKELVDCLKFFIKFRQHVKAYSFKYFLGLDKVYIVGGKEVGAKLRDLNLTSSPNNLIVKDAWEMAKFSTGGEINNRTWDWFGTILMAQFVDQLKDAYNLNDVDLEHPLMRQLFGEYVVRWARQNKGISREEWKILKKDNNTIKDIEKKYGISLKDIKLFGDESSKNVREIFEFYRQNPEVDRKTISKKINDLRNLEGKNNLLPVPSLL